MNRSSFYSCPGIGIMRIGLSDEGSVGMFRVQGRNDITTPGQAERIQCIIEGLKITLPAASLPLARKIAKEARKQAKAINRPVPILADIFSLLTAQPDPFAAMLNARADGILKELTASENQSLLVACRVVKSDMPDDNGVLSMAYWAVRK